jgi:iron complex outermembrane receptor protein
MVDLEGTHWFTDKIQLSANVFLRDNDTDSFNGDATPFVGCADDPATPEDESQLLCEEDQLDDPLVDQRGNFLAEVDFNAINNISTRDQLSYGGTLQSTFLNDLFGRENQLILSASFNEGTAEFRSQVEATALREDRSTTRTGIFIDGQDVALNSETRTWSVYFTDTFSVTPKLALTVSGRYNDTNVDLNNVGEFVDENADGIDDRTADHTFSRFNPAAGLTWQLLQEVGLYGSYSESARAPTPVELACADEKAPARCRTRSLQTRRSSR